MRYVGIAAAAAAFWLLVATLRLMEVPPATRQIVPMPPPPAAYLDRLSSDVSPAEDGRLSKTAILRGMDSVKPLIAGCYEQYQVPGLAMVRVDIAKSGAVSSATVAGRFAGTPTGACVEQAVRTAIFPASNGMTIPFPFRLH